MAESKLLTTRDYFRKFCGGAPFRSSKPVESSVSWNKIGGGLAAVSCDKRVGSRLLFAVEWRDGRAEIDQYWYRSGPERVSPSAERERSMLKNVRSAVDSGNIVRIASGLSFDDMTDEILGTMKDAWIPEKAVFFGAWGLDYDPVSDEVRNGQSLADSIESDSGQDGLVPASGDDAPGGDSGGNADIDIDDGATPVVSGADLSGALSAMKFGFKGARVAVIDGPPVKSGMFQHFAKSFNALGLKVLSGIDQAERSCSVVTMVPKGFPGKKNLAGMTQALLTKSGNSRTMNRNLGDISSPASKAVLSKADLIVASVSRDGLPDFLSAIESYGAAFLVAGPSGCDLDGIPAQPLAGASDVGPAAWYVRKCDGMQDEVSGESDGTSIGPGSDLDDCHVPDPASVPDDGNDVPVAGDAGDPAVSVDDGDDAMFDNPEDASGPDDSLEEPVFRPSPESGDDRGESSVHGESPAAVCVPGPAGTLAYVADGDFYRITRRGEDLVPRLAGGETMDVMVDGEWVPSVFERGGSGAWTLRGTPYGGCLVNVQVRDVDVETGDAMEVLCAAYGAWYASKSGSDFDSMVRRVSRAVSRDYAMDPDAALDLVARLLGHGRGDRPDEIPDDDDGDLFAAIGRPVHSVPDGITHPVRIGASSSRSHKPPHLRGE